MHKIETTNIQEKIVIDNPIPKFLIINNVVYKLDSWEEFVKIFYFNLSLKYHHLLDEFTNKNIILKNEKKIVVVSNFEKTGFIKVCSDRYVRVHSRNYKNNITILKWILKDTKYDFKLYLSSADDDLKQIESELKTVINRQCKRIKSNIKMGKRVCSYINRMIQSHEEKLFYRIEKEFDKCALIGDIVVSKEEDAILNKYMADCIQSIVDERDYIPHEKVFAYGLVRFACKHYNKNGKGGFWTYFKDEYGIDLIGKGNIQSKILDWFKDIIVSYKKNKKYYISNGGILIDNISMHSFIVDTCSSSFFDFLFDYWRIYLNRNIENMYEEPKLFNNLIEEINNYHRSSGVYSHTSRALQINPSGCKRRIKNILKRIDNAIWNSKEIDLMFNNSNRINILLKEWTKNPKGLFERERKIRGPKGAKLLSKPVLLYDDNKRVFEIHFSRQILANYKKFDSPTWIVEIGEKKEYVHVGLLDGKIGVYTDEISLEINTTDIFEDIILKLVYGNKEIKYSFKKENFKLFRKASWVDKYQYFDVRWDTIPCGSVICFSKDDNIPKALSSDYNYYSYDGYFRADYDFILDEIVILPNQRAIKVGSKLTEGINGGKLVKHVYSLEDKKCSVYSELPSILFKTDKSKLNGTALSINGKLNKVIDLKYYEFKLDDELTDVYGYYVDLSNCINDNGKYHVSIDIPGSLKKIDYSFVYIQNFNYSFNMKLLKYQTEGVIFFDKKFNFLDEHLNDGELWDTTTLPSVNAFKFSFEKTKDADTSVDGRFLNLKYKNYNEVLPLSVEIPAILWKYYLADEWHCKKPKDVYLLNIPEKIYFTGPFDFSKNHIYIDSIDFDYDETNITGRKIDDGIFQFDIKQLKSYFNPNIKFRKIMIEIDDNRVDLMNGYCKTTIKNYNLVSDRSTNIIYGKFEIYGNGNYSVNILQDNEIVLKDIQLVNGEFTIEDVDLDSGKYDVVVYETEAEDDLFGLITSEVLSSTEIDRYEIQIYNVSDISGKKIYLKGYSDIARVESPFEFESPFIINVLEQIKNSEIERDGYYYLWHSSELGICSKLDIKEAAFYIGLIHIDKNPEEYKMPNECKTEEECIVIFKNKRDLSNAIILIKMEDKYGIEYSSLCYDFYLKRIVLDTNWYKKEYIESLKREYYTQKKLLEKYQKRNLKVLDDDIVALSIVIKE